jgi:hypothetical protein
MALKLAWPMANEGIYRKCGKPKPKYTAMEVFGILQWMMDRTILERKTRGRAG